MIKMQKLETEQPNIRKIFLATITNMTFNDRMFKNQNTGEKIKPGYRRPTFQPEKEYGFLTCEFCGGDVTREFRGSMSGAIITRLICACSCGVSVI